MHARDSLSGRRVYAGLMLSSLIDSVAVGILMPAIPLLALQLGGNAFAVAALVSSQFVAGAFGALALGWLGDRVPRGVLLLATLAALALSYWLLPLAKTLPWLFGLRILTGFMSSNLVLLESFISDITTHDNRSAGIAKLRLGSTAGLILGPGMAGALTGLRLVDGVQGLLVLAAAVATLQPAVMAWALYGQLTVKRSKTPAKCGPAGAAVPGSALQRFLRTARIRDFALVKTLIATCFASLMAVTPVWAASHLGWGAKELSQLVSAFGIALLVVQLAIAAGAWPWLTTDAALFVACVIVVPGFLLLAVVPGPSTMLACCVLLGLSSAVVNIVVPSAISRMAPLEVGAMLGMVSTTVLLGSTIGPMALGAVYEVAGQAWAWAGGALCALVAAGLAWRHLARADGLAQAPADV